MNDNWCFGSTAICNFIGENRRRITYLVSVEKLPAFKKNNKGSWRALKSDLENWLSSQRKKYLK